MGGQSMMQLPLDLQPPCPFVAPQGNSIRIIVVGSGGTGSWLIQHLGRLVWEFNRKEEHIVEKRSASLLIIDHDSIEAKNVKTRQNFCPPEIGKNKAQVLRNRQAIAFTMNREEIVALDKPFSSALVSQYSADLIILVGCVDNAQARAEMANCLTFNAYSTHRHIVYIDAGNGEHWGQIFVGNTASLKELKGCLHGPICTRLPSPALLAPSMFMVPKEKEEETSTATVRLSCGDLVVDGQEGNSQSRTINNYMASLLYVYIENLVYRSITTFATFANLSLIDTHSSSITPQALAIALGKPPEFACFFTMHPDDDKDEEEEMGDEPDEDEILAAELEDALP
jgi:hypothetical protein